MKRILVTGNSGSGKSTFASQLGRILNLPVVHLDELYWQPNGDRVPEDEFVRRTQQAVAADQWIFEGFNIETFDLRAQRADTLILLDVPNWLCAWRLLFNRGQRIGVPADQPLKRRPLKDHARFLRWVWQFPWDRRPGLIADLRRYESSKQIIRLHSRRQAERLLHQLERKSARPAQEAGPAQPLE